MVVTEPRFRQAVGIVALGYTACFFMNKPELLDGSGEFQLAYEWCVEHFGSGQQDDGGGHSSPSCWMFNLKFNAVAFLNPDDAMQFKLRWC